jgi:hypothetical protein
MKNTYQKVKYRLGHTYIDYINNRQVVVTDLSPSGDALGYHRDSDTYMTLRLSDLKDDLIFKYLPVVEEYYGRYLKNCSLVFTARLNVNGGHDDIYSHNHNIGLRKLMSRVNRSKKLSAYWGMEVSI